MEDAIHLEVLHGLLFLPCGMVLVNAIGDLAERCRWLGTMSCFMTSTRSILTHCFPRMTGLCFFNGNQGTKVVVSQRPDFASAQGF